jgi:hypothetical protein
MMIDTMLENGSKRENLLIYTSVKFEALHKQIMTFEGIPVKYDPTMAPKTFRVIDTTTTNRW